MPATVLQELVTKFNFKGSINPLKDYNKWISGSIIANQKFALSILSLGAILNYNFLKRLKNMNPQAHLSFQSGESVKELNKLGAVVVKLGGDFDSFNSTIQALSDNLSSAALYGSSAYGELGIDIRGKDNELKAPTDIIREMRTRLQSEFSHLTPNQWLTLMGNVGIDKRFLGYMQSSDEELGQAKQKTKNIGGITDGETKKVREFNAELDLIYANLTVIKDMIAVKWADPFTAIFEKANEVFNMDGAKENMADVGSILGTVATVLASLLVFRGIGMGGTFVKTLLKKDGGGWSQAWKNATKQGVKKGAKGSKKGTKGGAKGSKKGTKGGAKGDKKGVGVGVGVGTGVGAGVLNKRTIPYYGMPALAPFFMQRDTIDKPPLVSEPKEIKPNSTMSPVSNTVNQDIKIDISTDNPMEVKDVIEETLKKGAEEINLMNGRGGI